MSKCFTLGGWIGRSKLFIVTTGVSFELNKVVVSLIGKQNQLDSSCYFGVMGSDEAAIKDLFELIPNFLFN